MVALGNKTVPATKIAPPDLAASLAGVQALTRAYDDLARAQARAAKAPRVNGPGAPGAGGAGGYGGAGGAGGGAGGRAPLWDRTGQGAGVQGIDRMAGSGYRNLQMGSRLTSTFTDPLIGAGKGILDYSADFQEAMQKTVSLASVSRGELDGLKRSVLSLSTDPNVRKGPAELADALYYVTSTGRKGAEGMEILRASALGASAGLGETKVVANTITTVLDAYGLSADKAMRATDTLTQAVRMGKGEADKFAGAFPKVIAIAAQAGISFEEVAAQMASATRVGLTPSETGTALRQIFNNLIDPSEKAKAAMRSMGTSVEELRQKLREKGLFSTLKDLSERTGGNIGPITELFGNIRALTGFLSTTGDSTLQSYKHTLDAIMSGQGATLTAASSASETLRFQMDKLQSTLEATGITIGTKYLPQINKMARAGQGNIAALPSAWGHMGDGEKGIIKVVVGLLAIVGPLNLVIGNFKVLYSMFVSLITVGGRFAALAAALTDPLLAVGVAIVAALGGAYLWNKFTKSLEDAKHQTALLAQNAQNLEDAFARALNGTTNPKIKASLEEVRKKVQAAGDDTHKLDAALKDAMEKRREVRNLHLAPHDELPIVHEWDRLILFLQSRRAHLGVTIASDAQETEASLQRRARAVGVTLPAPGASAVPVTNATNPNIAREPGAMFTSPGAAQTHQAAAVQSRQDALHEIERREHEARRLQRDLHQEDTRLAENAAAQTFGGRALAGLDRYRNSLAELLKIQRQFDADVKRGWKPTGSDKEAVGKVNARVKELQDKGHNERLKAQGDAAAKEAALEEQRQKQAAAIAERQRAIAAKSLQEQASMWQSYGNAVDGALGRIIGLSEQATIVGEKTARARAEAEMLKTVYHDIPEPLKRAVVELGAIEAKMKQIVGLRDAMREVFEGAYKSMVQAGMDPSAVRGGAKTMAREMGFAGTLNNLQSRAYGIGTGALNTSERNRAGLDAQREAMSFAGTGQAGVFDPAFPNDGVAAGKKVTSVMLKSLVSEFNDKSPRSLGASCADVASKVLNSIGHTIRYSANAAALEQNAKAAGWVRVPVGTAGSLNVQSGAGFGKISGHHVSVGLGNGMVGSSSGYRASFHGLSNGNPRAYLPPDALGGSITSPTGRTVPIVGASTDARLSSSPGVMGADGRLNRYGPLPAGWGGNVYAGGTRPGEVRTTREAMQSMLMEQQAQGVGISSHGARYARRFAGDVDLRLSMDAATRAAREDANTNVRAMRQLGKTDNPYLAFLEEVNRGLHQFVGPGTLQKKFKSILDLMQAQAGQTTLESVQGVYSERAIFDRGRKALQGGDIYGSNRAMERERKRREIRESAVVRGQYALEAAGALPKGSGDKLARTLTQQAYAAMDDATGRRRMTDAVQAANQFGREMQVLVQQREALGRIGDGPEQAIIEAFQKLSDEAEAYGRVVDEVGDVEARSLAKIEVGRKASLRERQREIDLLRERAGLMRAADEAEASLSSLRTSGITPQGRIEREMDAWRRGELKTKGSVDLPSAGAKRRELTAQSQSQAFEDATGRLNQLSQEQATLGDETGIAALKIEMQVGALQNLDAATKANLLTQTQAMALMRKRLEFADQVGDAEKSGELERAQTARQRLEIEWKYQDAARKRREDISGVTRDPAIVQAEKEAREKLGGLADQSEQFSRLREAGAQLRETISGSLRTGFDEGIGSGIQSFIKKMGDIELDAIFQKMATRYTRKVLGDDAVEDVKPGLKDAMRRKNRGASRTAGIMSTIGGFAGGTLGDGLGAVGAAMGDSATGGSAGGTSTINMAPNIVNVTTQMATINVTTARINVANGTVAGGGTSGGPGSKPSTEQTLISFAQLYASTQA